VDGVAVNGVTVVRYATTDPARINPNSYIGLQNHGDTAPVRFRNIRVKRDTPVYAGIVKGVGGRCLDITNGDPHQESVWMWPCDGGHAQVFASPGNGMLQAGGRCLGAKDGGTAIGTRVILSTCVDTAVQKWIFRGTDYVNVRSGRCLTADSGDQRALLHLADCTGRTEQLWTPPQQDASSGRLVSPQGRCLDVDNNDPMLGRVHMWDCNNGIAQVWTAPGDGTLRGDGKCLDVTGGVVANGSPVGLSTCAAVPSMQWVMQPDGSVVHPQSNRCLTAVNPDHGSTLSITDCGTNDRQKWTMTEESVFQGAVVGPGTKCLDVAGDNPNGEDLWLWECFGPQGQVWTAPGDGTLRAYGKCLDLRSLNNLTPVILWPCAPGVESQVWGVRPDGTIVNGMVNRCVDSFNGATTNGNDIVIYDCHRGFPQRWSTPGFPI